MVCPAHSRFNATTGKCSCMPGYGKLKGRSECGKFNYYFTPNPYHTIVQGRRRMRVTTTEGTSTALIVVVTIAVVAFVVAIVVSR